VTTLEPWLLEILACPSDDHAPLVLDEPAQELLCTGCDRAFPIRDGIPVLLLDEARHRTTSPTDRAGADAAPARDAG
jgi:uncharacterized protein YbaR (Trm112 family)